MSVNMEIIVKSGPVQDVLDKLAVVLSPASMVDFLDVHAVPWFRERAERRFSSEGDDASGKWKDLAPFTQDRRREGRESGYWDVGDDHPINQRTHELQNYIVNGKGNTLPMSYGARMLFPGGNPKGELVDKISTAQKGKDSPKTLARPVLALGPTDVESVLASLEEFVLKGVEL